MGDSEKRQREDRDSQGFIDAIRGAEQFGASSDTRESRGAGESNQRHDRQVEEPEAANFMREAFATTRDIAQMLRVHPKTVERLRKLHGLPFVRIGGSIRYIPERVASWASAQEG